MSLHDLANQVQSAGRGEDKVLVHMTPGEVGGLQSLAMAHGGSLTVNPETGLPEAGFLRSLLPMVAGFALGPAGLGLTAMQAGLASAAIGTVATGSLRQGLMAGLGAYGGAGLGQGLMAQGAQAIPPAGVYGTPAVSAVPTSTLAGNTALANVGAQPLQFTDDILAGVAKTPVSGPGQSVVFNQAGAGTGAAATPFPTYAQTQANILKSPMLQVAPPPPVPSVVTPNAVVGKTPVFTPSPQPVVTSTGGPNVAFNQSFAGGPTSAYTAQGTYNVGANLGATGTEGIAASQATPSAFSERMAQLGRGAKTSFSSMEGLKGLYNAMPTGSVVAGLGSTAVGYMDAQREKAQEEMRRRANKSPGLIRPYEFEYGATGVAGEPYTGSAERTYFQPTFTALTPYEAPGPEYRKAAGGLTSLAVGGPVEQMAAMNSVGMNTGYPMANLQTPMYSNPAMQRPEAMNVVAPSAGAGVGAYSGEQRFAKGGETADSEYKASSGYEYAYDPKTMQFTQTRGPSAPVNKSGGIANPVAQPTAPAQPFVPNIDIPAYQTPEQQLGLGGFYDYMNQQMGSYGGYAAGGGVSHLGDYSDGGRLLKGPGDGVSDSIPASIGNRQPARLADGEFVIPARIVSEIGNGSTEAGARKLYAMMDRVQRARRKTVGKGQVAKNTRAEKLLPA
jgi:hypothetical protein